MKIPTPPPRHVVDPTDEQHAFRFQSGETSRSLSDFHAHLASVPASVLWYHRSHFAPWLRHVLGDDPLARRVASFADEARDAEMLRELLRDLVAARLAQLT